ncbi:hypothetical protein [Frigidibacter sp.]|uniref:hypothetical protein n=1 Tax=Frigidibacter sp. TaxID=2586418 RepID=UPI002733424F|nr:hypothetical protein [Frigidibacter sp.]MDP3340270.1 hypothetical protein [Frigidibacter sp.]
MNRPLAAEPGPDAAPGTQEGGTAARNEGSAKIVSDAMRDQKLRQERLRHVQEFLTSPVFIDMRQQSITVSDSPAELAERKRDLDYRIEVLEAVLALLIEERDMLDRVVSSQG